MKPKWERDHLDVDFPLNKEFREMNQYFRSFDAFHANRSSNFFSQEIVETSFRFFTDLSEFPS